MPCDRQTTRPTPRPCHNRASLRGLAIATPLAIAVETTTTTGDLRVAPRSTRRSARSGCDRPPAPRPVARPTRAALRRRRRGPAFTYRVHRRLRLLRCRAGLRPAVERQRVELLAQPFPGEQRAPHRRFLRAAATAQHAVDLRTRRPVARLDGRRHGPAFGERPGPLLLQFALRGAHLRFVVVACRATRTGCFRTRSSAAWTSSTQPRSTCCQFRSPPAARCEPAGPLA